MFRAFCALIYYKDIFCGETSKWRFYNSFDCASGLSYSPEMCKLPADIFFLSGRLIRWDEVFADRPTSQVPERREELVPHLQVFYRKREGEGLREGVYTSLVWNTLPCGVWPPCTWPKNKIITCLEAGVGTGSTSPIQSSARGAVLDPVSLRFSAPLCLISTHLACFSSLNSIAGRICWNVRQKILHLQVCRDQKLSEGVRWGGKGESLCQNSKVCESPSSPPQHLLKLPIVAAAC